MLENLWSNGPPGQLLIIYFLCVKDLRKRRDNNEAVHHLFIDFKNAYDSFMRKIFYDILTEFGIPMKMVRLINNQTFEKPQHPSPQ